jgi:hypothetical protein
VRNQSDREAPWDEFHGIVDGLLNRIEVPGPHLSGRPREGGDP